MLKLQNKQTNKIKKVCIVHFNPIYPTFYKTTKQQQQQNQNKTRDIQAYFWPRSIFPKGLLRVQHKKISFSLKLSQLSQYHSSFSCWLLTVMLKTHLFNEYRFPFLTIYIEFQKLLGDDDQNNVKHLHSEIKKKRKSVIWCIQIAYFNMSSRIKMLEWTTAFGISQ